MKRNIIKLINTAISPQILVLIIALSCYQASAQENVPINPKLEVIAEPQSTANRIEFKEGNAINPETIFSDYKSAFDLSTDDEMRLIKSDPDESGFKHYHYQQYYKNLKVMFGEFIVHQQPDGAVKSANGRLITGLNVGNAQVLNEQQALSNALKFMNAKKYLWQNPERETDLKREEKDAAATYFPKGELAIAPGNYDATYRPADYKLAWHFKIYPDDINVMAKSVFIDALTGQVLNHIDIAMNCSATTTTSAFNGSVYFNTVLAGPLYYSQNDCQATQIYVYNCNGGGAVNNLYSDVDNLWTNNQSAVQAQWGAMWTYDYYANNHFRNSWDNANGSMIAYNNANAGQNNACWGCTGNSAIFYAGNTSAATDDWNTNDIMGHEFTHGVTQASAGLVYNKESGALNESFSDIFGEMIESWTEGNCDYLVGADRGAIRSFINPNAYGQPDTYLGTNWFSTSGCTPSSANDQCGVHTNSGVQNYWFYLLSEGGSGTNDLGNSFSVAGIGRQKARLIAYRALTVGYLTSTSGYSDARTASVHAARDLYGSCSAEAWQTANAWYAVGVGTIPVSLPSGYSVCGTLGASGSQAYSAQNTITNCTGGATVVAGVPTTFTAEQITLSPGFTATSGCDLRAYVTPCSTIISRPLGNNNASAQEMNFIKAEKLNANTYNTRFIKLSPNPFNNNFNLDINLTEDANVSVTIYDMMGKEVDRVMQNQAKQKGLVQLQYNNEKLHPNIYMCVIEINGKRFTEKIVKM